MRIQFGLRQILIVILSLSVVAARMTANWRAHRLQERVFQDAQRKLDLIGARGEFRFLTRFENDGTTRCRGCFTQVTTPPLIRIFVSQCDTNRLRVLAELSHTQPQIQEIELYCNGASVSSLNAMARMRSLKYLRIVGAELDGAMLVRDVPAIKALTLVNCKIAGISHIADLMYLDVLELQNVDCDAAGFERIKVVRNDLLVTRSLGDPYQDW